MDSKEFIKRNQRTKTSTNRNSEAQRRQRFKQEINFANNFTEMFIANKSNYQILADAKEYLLQLEGNPFNLVEGEANAKICSDYRFLCRKGEFFDGKLIRLMAKSVGKNRVIYYNPIVAQELINSTKDNKAKAEMTKRFNELKELPMRDGYKPM